LPTWHPVTDSEHSLLVISDACFSESLVFFFPLYLSFHS
jgi:hypothetical protein